MRRPRSGTHLIQRGEIWYYRRVVPKGLEKRCDVEFEQRLRRARDEGNPETRRALLASQIIEANPRGHLDFVYRAQQGCDAR